MNYFVSPSNIGQDPPLPEPIHWDVHTLELICIGMWDVRLYGLSPYVLGCTMYVYTPESICTGMYVCMHVCLYVAYPCIGSIYTYP